jgi:hypothetical protein
VGGGGSCRCRPRSSSASFTCRRIAAISSDANPPATRAARATRKSASAMLASSMRSSDIPPAYALPSADLLCARGTPLYSWSVGKRHRQRIARSRSAAARRSVFVVAGSWQTVRRGGRPRLPERSVTGLGELRPVERSAGSLMARPSLLLHKGRGASLSSGRWEGRIHQRHSSDLALREHEHERASRGIYDEDEVNGENEMPPPLV